MNISSLLFDVGRDSERLNINERKRRTERESERKDPSMKGTPKSYIRNRVRDKRSFGSVPVSGTSIFQSVVPNHFSLKYIFCLQTKH